MTEQQDLSIGGQPQEETKIKRYLRYGAIAFFLIFLAAVTIGAIVRKLSG